MPPRCIWLRMRSGLQDWYFYNREIIVPAIVGGIIVGLVVLAMWYMTTDGNADWMARSNIDLASGKAADLAVEYERLARAASLHERLGDDWKASVAHAHAAKTARAAAERWSTAIDRIGTLESDWGGTVAPDIRAAADNGEAGWRSIEATSWRMAADAAADAGRDRVAAAWSENAARAHAMAEGLYADAQLAGAGMDVSEVLDILDALDVLDALDMPDSFELP